MNSNVQTQGLNQDPSNIKENGIGYNVTCMSTLH